ncbi:MAG: hypothetical protein CM15mV6_0010 [uncultured marine virus]|nr:MAG: hypothetical protein CM15mV6_0010 [uncultured marine virus]
MNDIFQEILNDLDTLTAIRGQQAQKNNIHKNTKPVKIILPPDLVIRTIPH